MFWKSDKKAAPVAAPPPAPATPAARRVLRPPQPSLIGQEVTVFGDLQGAGVIEIRGTVTGGVQGRDILIDETGRVGEAVSAESVRIAGAAGGAVEGRTIVVDQGGQVAGPLRARGEVEVRGHLSGDIVARRILLGVTSRVQGSLSAEAVEVQGSLEGLIEAQDVTIAATATVIGNIVHNTLTMEKGAVHKGLRPWRPKAQK